MLVMLLLRFSSLLMILPFFLPLNKNCYQVENMFQVIKIREKKKHRDKAIVAAFLCPTFLSVLYLIINWTKTFY
jgi:hypothetical protein